MKRSSPADKIMAAVLSDESYDDRQLGQIVRLVLANGADYSDAGFQAGYEDGESHGYEVGEDIGYVNGYEEAEAIATVKRVYVGVWADDTELTDLGTTVRVVAVATTREHALALAGDYRDKRASGSVFAFNFPLHRVSVEDSLPV